MRADVGRNPLRIAQCRKKVDDHRAGTGAKFKNAPLQFCAPNSRRLKSRLDQSFGVRPGIERVARNLEHPSIELSLAEQPRDGLAGFPPRRQAGDLLPHRGTYSQIGPGNEVCVGYLETMLQNQPGIEIRRGNAGHPEAPAKLGESACHRVRLHRPQPGPANPTGACE